MDPLGGVQHRLSLALRDRVAGPDADDLARGIWLADGPRWFAPDDPVVRVHSSAAMYVGGIRALLLQAVHPLAMAGVGEHSGYRGDPWGRLARTSAYIAMTTFGPVAAAEEVFARIRRVHGTVRGTAPDGRPYSAEDPHLLRWVHVAEIDSFLRAHQVLGARPLTPAEADRYVAQAAVPVRRLGLTDPPVTLADLAEQLAGYDDELAATPGALDVAQLLLREPPLPAAQRPGFAMLAAGAVALLPRHVRRMLSLPTSALGDRVLRRPLARVSTGLVGWALADPRSVPQHPRSSQRVDRRAG